MVALAASAKAAIIEAPPIALGRGGGKGKEVAAGKVLTTAGTRMGAGSM